MATPGFQELFESRIKNYFYVRRDSYTATEPNSFLFPPVHGDIKFRYKFAFKNCYLDYVECYITYDLN